MGDLLADLSDLGANLHILTWLVTLIGLQYPSVRNPKVSGPGAMKFYEKFFRKTAFQIPSQDL